MFPNRSLYFAVYYKYRTQYDNVKSWSTDYRDTELLTKFHNALMNFQNADDLNRSMLLATVHAQGSLIEQREQQLRQQHHDKLYQNYKSKIDQLKNYESKRGNKLIKEFQTHMTAWRDANIEDR